MKKLLLILVLMGISCYAYSQKKIVLTSPNGELQVSLNITDKIYYDISFNNDVLLENNYLQLSLKNEVLGQNPKLSNQKRSQIKTQSQPIVPLKYSTVKDEYNQLLLNFKGDYSVEFRAYNDGVAYRFITNKKVS